MSTAFKVGDTVEFRPSGTVRHNAQKGALATVTGTGGSYLEVKWDRVTNGLARTQMDGGYFYEDFVLAKPRVGDVIEITKTQPVLQAAGLLTRVEDCFPGCTVLEFEDGTTLHYSAQVHGELAVTDPAPELPEWKNGDVVIIEEDGYDLTALKVTGDWWETSRDSILVSSEINNAYVRRNARHVLRDGAPVA